MKATLISRVHFKLALNIFVRCHLCLCNRCQASHPCKSKRRFEAAWGALEVLWSTPWILWFDRGSRCGNKTIFSSQTLFHSFTQLSTWQWNIIWKWYANWEMMRCFGLGQASTSVSTRIAMESTRTLTVKKHLKREFSIVGAIDSSVEHFVRVQRSIKSWCDIVQNKFQDPGHGFLGKRNAVPLGAIMLSSRYKDKNSTTNNFIPLTLQNFGSCRTSLRWIQKQ
jgi:hypothetical protein